MIQSYQRPIAGNVFPQAEILTPKSLIEKLAKICESRVYAVNAYPNSPFAALKLNSIGVIRFELKNARAALRDKERVKICLSLERYFLRLAPASVRARTNYYQLIEQLMGACNSFLKYQAS